jgi:hypothetical protein
MNWHLASTVGDAYDTGGGPRILIHGISRQPHSPLCLTQLFHAHIEPPL